MVRAHADPEATRSKHGNGNTAVAERPERTPVVDDFEGSDYRAARGDRPAWRKRTGRTPTVTRSGG